MMKKVGITVAAGGLLAMTLITLWSGGVAALQEESTAVTFFDLETHVPRNWVRQEPSSSMRLLQMVVPGEGAGDAELVVFFFGPGQGGDVEANIARWRSQFSTDDGGPVEARVDRFTVSAMPVTVAELTGTYRRGVGGGPAAPRTGQTLVAAVIETERGSLFAQMHGPAETVAAWRVAFDGFLRGLRPVG